MRKGEPQKLLTIVLTGVYFLTQVALGHASEVNFWSDRRKVTSPSQPTQLAALPASLMNQMPAINPALRVSGEWVTTPHVKARTSAKLDSLIQAVPLTHGTLQDTHDGEKNTEPVILVQDVHLNSEAQTNIASILQNLINQKQLAVVGVEGAFTPFDFTRFRAHEDKENTRLVAQAFLEKNLIAAPSFVGMTSPAAPPAFIGVDDPARYDANVNAYLNSRDTRDSMTQRLKKLEQTLLEDKKQVLSPDLLRFDAQRTAHYKGTLELGAYVDALTRYDVNSDMAVQQFVEAHRMESSLNFTRVEAERRMVIEKLAATLNEEETTLLLAQSLAYRMGRLGFGTYYEGLKQLCRNKGVDLSRTPAFDNYIGYVLLSDGIKAEALFAGIRKLEEDIITVLATTGEEKNLLRQSAQLELANKLINFSLTPAEWEEYKKVSSTSFLVPSEVRLGTRHQALGTLNLGSFEAFYEEADARSRMMIEKLMSHPAEGNRALVLGGFHAPYTAAILRDKKIPYAVVSPKLTRVDAEAGSSYLSVFDREKTPLDRLFKGEKIFLASGHTAVGAIPSQNRLPETTGRLSAVAGETEDLCDAIIQHGGHGRTETTINGQPYRLTPDTPGATNGVLFHRTRVERVTSMLATIRQTLQSLGLKIISPAPLIIHALILPLMFTSALVLPFISMAGIAIGINVYGGITSLISHYSSTAIGTNLLAYHDRLIFGRKLPNGAVLPANSRIIELHLRPGRSGRNGTLSSAGRARELFRTITADLGQFNQDLDSGNPVFSQISHIKITSNFFSAALISRISEAGFAIEPVTGVWALALRLVLLRQRLAHSLQPRAFKTVWVPRERMGEFIALLDPGSAKQSASSPGQVAGEKQNSLLTLVATFTMWRFIFRLITLGRWTPSDRFISQWIAPWYESPVHWLPQFLSWHGKTTIQQRFGQLMIYRESQVGLAKGRRAAVMFAAAFLVFINAALVGGQLDVGFVQIIAAAIFAMALLSAPFGLWLGGVKGHFDYIRLAHERGWAPLTLGNPSPNPFRNLLSASKTNVTLRDFSGDRFGRPEGDVGMIMNWMPFEQDLLGIYRVALASRRMRGGQGRVTIVDVGAGSGFLAHLLAQHFDVDVIAIEPEADRVENAEKVYGELEGRKGTLRYRQGTAETATDVLAAEGIAEPDLVINSWMPSGLDFTSDIRNINAPAILYVRRPQSTGIHQVSYAPGETYSNHGYWRGLSYPDLALLEDEAIVETSNLFQVQIRNDHADKFKEAWVSTEKEKSGLQAETDLPWVGELDKRYGGTKVMARWMDNEDEMMLPFPVRVNERRLALTPTPEQDQFDVAAFMDSLTGWNSDYTTNTLPGEGGHFNLMWKDADMASGTGSVQEFDLLKAVARLVFPPSQLTLSDDGFATPDDVRNILEHLKALGLLTDYRQLLDTFSVVSSLGMDYRRLGPQLGTSMFTNDLDTKRALFFQNSAETFAAIVALVPLIYQHAVQTPEAEETVSLNESFEVRRETHLTFSYSEGFVVETRNYLCLKKEAATSAVEFFRSNPAEAITVFELSHANDAAFSPELRAALWQAAPAVQIWSYQEDLQDHPSVAWQRAAQSFTRLMGRPEPLRDTLWEMDRIGILEAWQPEYRRVKYLPSNLNVYAFSVGQHTLHLMKLVDDFLTVDSAIYKAARPIRAELTENEILQLRMAVLFHDLGKRSSKTATEADHAIIGAIEVAPPRLRRYGLHNIVRPVSWLIRNHMMWNHYAREIPDTEFARSLPLLIETVLSDPSVRPHYLSLFYLISLADTLSVNPRRAPWPAALEKLMTLFDATRDYQISTEDDRDRMIQELWSETGLIRAQNRQQFVKENKTPLLGVLETLDISDYFSRVHPVLARDEAVEAALRERVRNYVSDPTAYDPFFERCLTFFSIDYLRSKTLNQVADLMLFVIHLEILKESQSDTALVFYSRRYNRGYEGHYEIMVGAGFDRPNFFTSVTGALLAQRFSIQGAAIHTQDEGLIIDDFYGFFRKDLPDEKSETEMREELATDINRLLQPENVARISDMFNEKDLPYEATRPGPAEPTDIYFLSDQTTNDKEVSVLRLETPDFPGLLHVISVVKDQLGLNLEDATIGTFPLQTGDFFYLSRDGRALTDAEKALFEARLSQVLRQQTIPIGAIEGDLVFRESAATEPIWEDALPDRISETDKKEFKALLDEFSELNKRKPFVDYPHLFESIIERIEAWEQQYGIRDPAARLPITFQGVTYLVYPYAYMLHGQRPPVNKTAGVKELKARLSRLLASKDTVYLEVTGREGTGKTTFADEIERGLLNDVISRDEIIVIHTDDHLTRSSDGRVVLNRPVLQGIAQLPGSGKKRLIIVEGTAADDMFKGDKLSYASRPDLALHLITRDPLQTELWQRIINRAATRSPVHLLKTARARSIYYRYFGFDLNIKSADIIINTSRDVEEPPEALTLGLTHFVWRSFFRIITLGFWTPSDKFISIWIAWWFESPVHHSRHFLGWHGDPTDEQRLGQHIINESAKNGFLTGFFLSLVMTAMLALVHFYDPVDLRTIIIMGWGTFLTPFVTAWLGGMKGHWFYNYMAYHKGWAPLTLGATTQKNPAEHVAERLVSFLTTPHNDAAARGRAIADMFEVEKLFGDAKGNVSWDELAEALRVELARTGQNIDPARIADLAFILRFILSDAERGRFIGTLNQLPPANDVASRSGSAAWADSVEQAKTIARERLKGRAANDRLVIGFDAARTPGLAETVLTDPEFAKHEREGRLDFVAGHANMTALDFVDLARQSALLREAGDDLVNLLIMEGTTLPTNFFSLTTAQRRELENTAAIYFITQTLKAIPVGADLLPDWNEIRTRLIQA